MSLQSALAFALAFAVALAAYLGSELGDARQQVVDLKVTVERTAQDNATLTDSLTLQNAKVLELQVTSLSDASEAGTRADTALQTLPAKIKQDRATGPTPKEANQWLTNLFSE